jgi:hypothetical protein
MFADGVFKLREHGLDLPVGIRTEGQLERGKIFASFIS